MSLSSQPAAAVPGQTLAEGAGLPSGGSQWDNFLCNLGTWEGSFTSVDAHGTLLESTPSLLTLEQGAGERLVHFGLRRYGNGAAAPPTRELSQDYRSLGKQVVFFASGSFCKGSLQLAPATAFTAEFGFNDGDRRHRLVQLHSPEGAFETLVLIREFRAGSGAGERPALAADQLLGLWSGQAATLNADWPTPDLDAAELRISSTAEGGSGQAAALHFHTRQGSTSQESGQRPERLLLLPDGGYVLAPLQVSHREAFTVEAGWLPEPGRMERLIRRYDASGAWISATWMSLHRQEGGA